jgi:hypothetical protein
MSAELNERAAAMGLLLLNNRPEQSRVFDLGKELDDLLLIPPPDRALALLKITKAAVYFDINENDIQTHNALGAIFNCLPSHCSHIDLVCTSLIMQWRTLLQWRRVPCKGDHVTMGGIQGHVVKKAVKCTYRDGFKTYASFLNVQTARELVWVPFVGSHRIHLSKNSAIYHGPELYCIKDRKLIRIMPKSACEMVASGVLRFCTKNGYVDKAVSKDDNLSFGQEQDSSQVKSA